MISGMRWLPVLLLSLSGVSSAAPGQITLKVQQGDLWDVASKLAQASGCRISWFGASRHKIDLDVTAASVWEVLAKLEVDHGVVSRFSWSGITMEVPISGQKVMSRGDLEPPPTWTRHWRVAGTQAVALLPGDPASGGRTARLVVLDQDATTIDRVVIERATANGRKLTVTPGAGRATQACAPSVIDLALDGAPTKLSLRGHVVLQRATSIVHKIEVPLDDRVVDLSEGRLRVHIASSPRNTGREIHLGWDGMGEATRVTAKLVDEQGAPVTTAGHGSGYGSNGMGHERWTVSASPGKLFLIVSMPSRKTVTEKLPFRFDNEPIAPAP